MLEFISIFLLLFAGCLLVLKWLLLGSSDWSWTDSIAQPDLWPTTILLSQPSECCDYTGVYHHAWFIPKFLKKCLIIHFPSLSTASKLCILFPLYLIIMFSVPDQTTLSHSFVHQISQGQFSTSTWKAATKAEGQTFEANCPGPSSGATGPWTS